MFDPVGLCNCVIDDLYFGFLSNLPKLLIVKLKVISNWLKTRKNKYVLIKFRTKWMLKCFQSCSVFLERLPSLYYSPNSTPTYIARCSVA